MHCSAPTCRLGTEHLLRYLDVLERELDGDDQPKAVNDHASTLEAQVRALAERLAASFGA